MRGPAGELALGTSREEVLRAAGGKPQVLADGALLVTPREAATPYDALLVYLDGDRVSRIVARQAQTAPPKATPALQPSSHARPKSTRS